MSQRNISISDADLDSCFDPWHRESRVYEHIDDFIKGPTRYLFLEYYGTITLSYSACPDAWCQKFSDHGGVYGIVLELIEQPRSCQILQEVDLNDSFITMTKQLWTEIKDHEYIHIFVHLYEMVDLLHQINIIHADVKPDNLADYDITKSSVLFDFSSSWVYTDNLPCLDPFKRKPRTLDERRDGELDAVRQFVIRYTNLLCLRSSSSPYIGRVLAVVRYNS